MEGRGPAHEIDGRAQNGVLVSPIICVDYGNYPADTMAEADSAHGRMRARAWTPGPKQPTGDA